MSDLALLHRPADLRVGHLDRHHARRRGGDAQPAGRAVSGHHAGVDLGVRDVSRRIGRRRRRTASPSPIEQQINGADRMLYMESSSSSSRQHDDHRLFRDRHQSRARAGRRAEPRQPRAADPARCGAAAGRLGAEALGRVHDGHRDLFAGEPLRRRLHRELREPLRARRAEAPARRRTDEHPRLARSRDAHLAQARPHGRARHRRGRHPARGRGAEPAVRGRQHRPVADRQAGGAIVRGDHARPHDRAGGVREHHPPRVAGRRARSCA